MTHVFQSICDIPWYIQFSRGIPLLLISVCTSGPLYKWHVQVVIVISCQMFAGALDAPPRKSVSNQGVCAVISMSSDAKA